MGGRLARLAPGGSVVALAALVLLALDTGWGPTLRFGVLLGLGIALPGVLWWRALRGNADGFVTDIAFGTGLGCALTMLLYLPARAAGLPLLVLAFPAGTVAAFALVPRLRRCWLSAGPRFPGWWCWTVAAACWVGIAAIVRFGLVFERVWFPQARFQYVDMPYHLALAGELKHQFPVEVPYVAGEPLRYHWFVYAEAASMSWQSGIELDPLLRRFLPVLAMGLTVLGVAVLATWLASRLWAGPVAAILLATVSSFDVFGWNGTRPALSNSYANGILLVSPTHGYGVVIALWLCLVLVSLLRHPDLGRRGNAVLLVIGLAAVSGAKVTMLPLFGAGMALVLLVRTVTGRRVDRTAVVLLGAITVAWLASYLLLYRGSDGSPFDTGGLVLSQAPRLGFPLGADDGTVVWSGTATFAVSWAVAGLGLLGLLRAGVRRDPAVPLLGGIVLAGLVAPFLLHHFAAGELYFTRAAFPFAVAGSAWGLTVLYGDRPAGVAVPRLLAAYALGVGLVWALGAITDRRPRGDTGTIAWQITWPWLVALAAATVIGLALGIGRLPPGAAAGLGVVTLLGASSLHVPAVLLTPVEDECRSGPDRPGCPAAQLPSGGGPAARFVRENSRPGDVIATNAHCAPVPAPPRCDSRSFWLSAYAERRVLLEGWSYTVTANRMVSNGAVPFLHPFWDPAMQRANDIVFSRPTHRNLSRLRDRHGVRWLVHDTSRTGPPPAALDALLPRRFASGSVVVYELTG